MRTRKTNPEQFLLDTISLCPQLSERMRRDADLAGHRHGHYCTAPAARSASGTSCWAMPCVHRPGISTGVFLAMHSAFVGADAVEAT
jgi:hypothetical protein